MINRKISNQEIYKRALCDSDFDGCICAAILKEVFPDIELHFADPGSIQSGRYGQWVNADTIIADLPYIEGCGLYFDHHLGNKPGHEINGSWQLTPCAAEIVLEYFKQSLDVTKYKELVARLADFDSGNVNLADIKDPDIYMQLGFAIDRKDKDFQMFFATFLATHSWEETLAQERVQEKLAAAKIGQEDYIAYASKHTMIMHGLAFLDMKEYKGDAGHSFFVAMLYPDTKGVVIIKYDNRGVRFHFFRNVFNSKPDDSINFLDIAKALSPLEAGGHKNACGCALPQGMSVAAAIDKVNSLIGE